MIQISDKCNCCGCAACVQICPKQCISFNEDKQGFCYPLVNQNLCIDCGLCEKVCPYISIPSTQQPIKVYAAINPNEKTRIKSSSGGIFALLAESIIDQGGIIFGARFDEKWEVIHDYTTTKEGIEAFQGSKYMQSRIGNTYKQVRDFLNNNRIVLFTGTGCQIIGLKRFLKKEYENLLTVEIICHGVPSPLVWRQFLKSTFSNNSICSINFRDKRNGWTSYGLNVITTDNTGQQNIHFIPTINNDYMQLYLKHINIRPSCSYCPSKSGKSGADIILGDFWGIKQYSTIYSDNKGTSAILINTAKGNKEISKINAQMTEMTFEQIVSHNPSLVNSTPQSKYYNEFWQIFTDEGYNKAINVLDNLKPSFLSKFFQRIANKIHKLK